MRQEDLFPPDWPRGLSYRAEFISHEEERSLLERIAKLPLEHSQYKEYTARRRTVSYGSTYDFTDNRSLPAEPIPAFLDDLRSRLAAWCEIPPQAFEQALISEYRPGTPLGWHRDVPEFEVIAGVSLLGSCRLRFRPYPPDPKRRRDAFALELEPRSAYILRDAARWGWQHSVPPVAQLRYSITLRTRRGGNRAERVAFNNT